MAAAVAEPPRRDGPVNDAVNRGRLTPERRKELQRKGFLDGDLGIPDPSLTLGLVTTPVRTEIVHEAVEILKAGCLDYSRQLSAYHGEIIMRQAHIDTWRQEIQRIAEKLDGEGLRGPGDDEQVPRRASEAGRSEAFVRDRRERERKRDRRPLEARQEQLEQDIETAAQRIGTVKGGIQAVAAEQQSFQSWIAATCRLSVAIYDAALLSRHHLAELVRPILVSVETLTRDWEDSAGSGQAGPDE